MFKSANQLERYIVFENFDEIIKHVDTYFNKENGEFVDIPIYKKALDALTYTFDPAKYNFGFNNGKIHLISNKGFHINFRIVEEPRIWES